MGNLNYPAEQKGAETIAVSPVSLCLHAVKSWLASGKNIWFKVRETIIDSSDQLVVKGALIFCCGDEENRLKIYHSPLNPEDQGPRYIADQYDDMEIRFQHRGLPIVMPGNQVQKIARRLGKKPIYFHVNDNDGSCCLCVNPELRAFMKRSDAVEMFIPEIVIPFFYSISCAERKLELPKWGAYKHGSAGLIEFYGDRTERLSPEEFQDFLADFKILQGLAEFYRECNKRFSEEELNAFMSAITESAKKEENQYLLQALEGDTASFFKPKNPLRSLKWLPLTLSSIGKKRKSLASLEIGCKTD